MESRRLKLTDTVEDMLEKMSEGSPSVTAILKAFIKRFGPMLVMTMDDLGLYGPDIWVAYSDVCGMDLAELRDRIRDDGEMLVFDVERARL